MTEVTNSGKWMRAFEGRLPGVEAQLKMAPEFRASFNTQSNPVRAAVMILIYPHKGKDTLVFMKRNAYDGPHSAQVSFPGGAWEQGDKSLKDTALREIREEMGIKGRINLLGALTPLHIPVSNFMVSPFAGWMEARPQFLPDPIEVQYVIESSVESLMNPSNQSKETLHRDGQSIIAPYYRVGQEKIWGATAMMLCEFLQLAARLQ